MSSKTVAESFLDRLGAHGVEWLFANAGTDFAPLIEARARGGSESPRLAAVPHEVVAVGMAHGYYLATGRPQAVMVHVDVGVANGLVGIMNAARANVPILFISGRTPHTEQGHLGSRDLPIHWGQEMFDQASLVREHVKWHYELAHASQIRDVVDRALAIAMAEPRGPVYLSLPREVLAADAPRTATASEPQQRSPSPPHPDPDAVYRAAVRLSRAERPLVVASVTEVDRHSSRLLQTFVERFALPFVDFWPSRLALPTDHSLHAGFDPGPLLCESDVIVVLDALVPWIPSRHRLAEHCEVIQIGVDPTFSTIPFRGHRSTLPITSTWSTAVAALSAALDPMLAGDQPRLDRRRSDLARDLRAQRQHQLQSVAPASGGIDRGWLSRQLDRAKDDDAIVVNELGCDLGHMSFRELGTYFGISLAGGLGWGLPAALGLQLAERARVVIATVGDGSYTFANPVACHHAASMLDLPVLTVVVNNGGWEAVRQSTLALYPDGAASSSEEMPLTSLAPTPSYAQVIEACGGYGERVESAGELPGALERALRVVGEERRQALLDVIIEPALRP